MADIIIKVPDAPPKPKRCMPPPSEAQEAARWKPGESGNPAGRPKGSGKKLISEAYNATLESQVPKEVLRKYGYEDLAQEWTWSDLIADMVLNKMLEQIKNNGSLDMLREVREVTEGKIADKVETTGKNGAPLQVPNFNIVFKKPKEA